MAKNETVNVKDNSEVNGNEETEPWDQEDYYYEQWRDEQAASGKWKNEKIELGT